jgi:hypothetical protein
MMMRSNDAFLPDNGRLLERNKKGITIVHHYKSLSKPKNSSQTKVLDFLISVIFAEGYEEKINQLAEIGLDYVFLRDVAASLEPDSSALVFYIPRNMLLDTRRLLSALSLLNGTLYHASFPDIVENAILTLEHSYSSKSNN